MPLRILVGSLYVLQVISKANGFVEMLSVNQ